MLSKYEQNELVKIYELEKEYINNTENSLTSKSLNKLAKPLKPLKDGIESKIPQEITLKIQKAIEVAIEGLLNAGQDVVKYTYDKDYAVKKLKNDEITCFEDLYMAQVEDLDRLAVNICIENKTAGLVEGAVMGLGDINAAIADIPLFFLITFRVMQQIAAIYGFDPEDENEKLFMIKLLNYGTAFEASSKLKVHSELQILRVAIKRHTFKKLQEMGGKYSVIIAARNIAQTVGKKLTKNTLLKGIPLLGAVFGGFFNYGFVNRVAKITNRQYKKRFLEDKSGIEYSDDIITIMEVETIE